MSPGLDELGEKFRRYGVPTTVANHSRWSALATEAIAQYKRGQLRTIMIIGHSMGGGAALDMAAELGQAGVPVEFVASIDPVGTLTVPANVHRTVNFYVEGGLGAPVEGAGKRRGTIQNLGERNPAIGHISIIAAHEHQLIGYVLTATRSSKVAPAAQAQSRAPAD
jgi:dienelactone hydrolase